MSALIKENTIFEEVENKCKIFVNDSPVMDKYKKREVDAYFFDRSIELDLKKAKEQGIIEGKEQGIIEGKEQGIIEGMEKGKEQGIIEGKEQGIIEGKEQGIIEGKEQGIKENQILMAKNMKNKGMDIYLIGELTGLSIEEIENL